MRKFVFKLITVFILSVPVFAQTNPLYQLPLKLPEKNPVVKDNGDFLVGTDKGLFQINTKGQPTVLWNGGKVQRIMRVDVQSASGSVPHWYFVTDNGILYSENLIDFETRNKGLPVFAIKEYNGVEKSFSDRVHPLKDFCVDPLNSDIMITATKDAVYLSRDAGLNWKSIGSSSANSSGMKAVAVAHMPVYDNSGAITGTELVVFQSHPIYGFSYYRCDVSKPGWVDVSAGFDIMKSLSQVDEISDILPVVCKDDAGNIYCDIYCAQTYIPNMYRFNWKTRRGEKIYTGTEAADTIDGLCQSNNLIVFNTLGKIQAFSLSENRIVDLPSVEYANWKRLMSTTGSAINSAYIPTNYTGLNTPLQLNELWMMYPDAINSAYGDIATDKKAIYVSPYYLRNIEGITKYKQIITENKLDAIVVDMKDDYGLLRFNNPQSELLKTKGKLSSYCVDLEQFIGEFKKDNIYLVARIVVFKDRNLARYGNCKYAVWDYKNNIPWVGIKDYEDVLDENGNIIETKTNYYDENWVDPYSEEVWEYNIEIAKELIARGFDEIQFDYIRFPTDGKNMSDVRYRWRDQGMDKESALVSFLSYARKNINAPIGIDIYGANGWYRSGARTGQDVELMSDYVDVICPMFYPSHFEQSFMDYAPSEERPYRIYFYGSFRNTVMGRNKIVVRPWLQAFYLNVRYDKLYYNADYVQRQVFGTRDGLNRGYMYWNNSGRYDDIRPDPDANEMSPWIKNEGALQERIPAFSSNDPSGNVGVNGTSGAALASNEQMIQIWDSVLEKNYREDEAKNASISNWLYIQPLEITK